MKLQNKVAVVTGGSRGIGRATVLEFAKEGADIVIVYNKASKEADEVAASIKKLGREAIVVKCDVSNEEDVKEMARQTIDKFGRVDILVNNAGIVFDIPFKEKTVEQWRKTLDINLVGTFLCCKYFSPYMLKHKSGQIVNISSINGIDAVSASSMDYDASKAGMIAMTKSLAEELVPYVRVNTIAPGWVDTDINAGLPKEYMASEAQKACLKRIARPEEIAKVVLFLASDDASYITRSVITVDGGYK
jgi:3-oxoacyl-[acyl-carrier protein] reductase